MPTSPELLANLPSLLDSRGLGSWLDARLQEIRRLASCEPTHIYSSQYASETLASDGMGKYTDPLWQAQVVATLLADWASYSSPVDRVSLHRLQFVMHVCPESFRVWWVKSVEGQFLPVGYSALYPISEATFRLLETEPDAITDRGMAVPLSLRDNARPYLYLFNYSVSPQFHHSHVSRVLLQNLATDVAATNWRGISAIAVSDAGIRVAERFGMMKRGTCLVDGSIEHVLTLRRA